MASLINNFSFLASFSKTEKFRTCFENPSAALKLEKNKKVI